MLQVATKLTFILLFIGILEKALSSLLSIRPFSLVIATEFVGHFTMACYLTLIEAAFVNVAILKILFALAMCFVFQPFSLIAISILVSAGALAVPFVLLIMAEVNFSVCLSLLTETMLFVRLNVAFKAISLPSHYFGVALLSAIFPKTVVKLARTEHFHAVLAKLTITELTLAESAIRKNEETLPFRLLLAVDFTCVAHTILYLLILHKCSFLAYFLVNTS